MKKNVIFLPEIGTFFNRDIDLAKCSVDRLVAYGATCIKGEVLHDPEICLKGEFYERYYDIESQKWVEVNYRELIEKKVNSIEQYHTLFSHVLSRGCDLALSVYDARGVEFAGDLKAKFVKISSSNITHRPLIDAISKLNSTILLDTGHASTEEIGRAVGWLSENRVTDFVIEHSPPAPPAPVTEHNLQYMVNLGRIFGCRYGLSDHHAGLEMMMAAVAMGASVIEKGIKLGSGVDQDTAHAMDIDDVPYLIQALQNIALGLGNGSRTLLPNRKKYQSRMGLIAKVPIASGELLCENNVSFAFPCLGIPVEQIESIKDVTVRKDIEEGQPIFWHDISIFPQP